MRLKMIGCFKAALGYPGLVIIRRVKYEDKFDFNIHTIINQNLFQQIPGLFEFLSLKNHIII